MIADIHDILLPDNTEWYFEHCIESDSLLITVGDSWTWGGSLGRTTREFDDRDHRVKHIYGFHLSNMLQCDFINIGVSGGSNLYILDYLVLVLKKITKTYKKRYIVFTLTESGRELGNSLLNQKDMYLSLAGKDWPMFEQLIAGKANSDEIALMMSEIDNIHFGHVVGLFLSLCNSTGLIDALSRYERYTIDAIRKTIKNDLYLARNFTSGFAENSLDTHLRWVDVIADKGKLQSYPSNLYVMTQSALDPLIKFCDHLGINPDRRDWVELMDTASKGIDWLLSSPYNSNRATKHPLEQAHMWWAEYLYGELQSKEASYEQQ